MKTLATIKSTVVETRLAAESARAEHAAAEGALADFIDTATKLGPLVDEDRVVAHEKKLRADALAAAEAVTAAEEAHRAALEAADCAHREEEEALSLTALRAELNEDAVDIITHVQAIHRASEHAAGIVAKRATRIDALSQATGRDLGRLSGRGVFHGLLALTALEAGVVRGLPDFPSDSASLLRLIAATRGLEHTTSAAQRKFLPADDLEACDLLLSGEAETFFAASASAESKRSRRLQQSNALRRLEEAILVGFPSVGPRERVVAAIQELAAQLQDDDLRQHAADLIERALTAPTVSLAQGVRTSLPTRA